MPMRPLNVFIGPNASGKSNFIEILNLLKYAPVHLESPISTTGGINEWLWKGRRESDDEKRAQIDIILSAESDNGIRHLIEFGGVKNSLQMVTELIEQEKVTPGEDQKYDFYTLNKGRAVLHDADVGDQRIEREIDRSVLDLRGSILSQLKDPDPGRYKIFEYLQTSYSGIQIYKDWTFGSDSTIRSSQLADGALDFVNKDGRNIVSIIASMDRKTKNDLLTILQNLYSEIAYLRIAPAGAGLQQLMIEEEGGIEVPAQRLSDGTLRFLFLAVILMNPNPPPIIVIEEPELGLHPDVIPKVGDLLLQASRKTQVVVTTHSRMLVDFFGAVPEDVVVCNKENGSSVMERLSSNHLKEWLEKYSLGELWSNGEIGGNRW